MDNIYTFKYSEMITLVKIKVYYYMKMSLGLKLPFYRICGFTTGMSVKLKRYHHLLTEHYFGCLRK